MVTGDLGHEESSVLLRSLLEFESQKHGLPIEFKLVDFCRPPQESFQKTVKVYCHGEGGRQAITLPFEDGSVRVDTRSYVIKGLVFLNDVPTGVIGFRGEDYLHPVAHVEANKLYIYHNLLDMPVRSEEGINVLAKFFDLVFSAAMPLLKTTIETYDYSDERKRYADIKLMALKSKERELADNIAVNERELQNCMDGIVRYTRALQADRELIDCLKARTERRKSEDAGKEYTALQKLVPQPYREIIFDEKELKAFTNLITINHEDTDYDIGEFEISVAFESGRLRITNLTNPHDDYQHPHISSPESICLGNVSLGVGKFVGDAEYVGLLQVLHQFLQSVNPHDAYHDIRHWGDDDFNDFDSCIENSSTWDCLDCRDGDCPYWDNRHERCWENSSTNDCIECGVEGCSYRDDAMDNCHSEHSPRECMECQQACSYQFDEFGCREDAEDLAEMDGVLPCIGCDITGCQYAEDKSEEPEPAEADDEVVGNGEQEDNTDRLTAILQEEA